MWSNGAKEEAVEVSEDRPAGAEALRKEKEKMRRALLLSVLAAGALGGQAFAGLSLTLNRDAALMLTEISHNPSGLGIISDLLFVTEDAGKYDPHAGMQGQVGYVGLLDATTTQKHAWMRIGADAATPKDAGDVIGAVLGGHSHDLT